MPSLHTHVPDSWEYKDQFWSRVRADYRGKPGPYIRDAIERDLKKQAAAGGNLMVALARELLGEWGEKQMADAVTGKNQRDELSVILNRYIADHSEKPKRSAHPFKTR